MELTLSSKDFVLLKNILERYVSNLRMEIAGTENAQWRREMHEDEDRAKQMLARLNSAQPAEAGAGPSQFQIMVEGFVLVRD